MTLHNPKDYDLISEGESITVSDFREAIEKQSEVTLRCADGREIKLDLTLTERQRAILLSGGLLAYTKKNS